MVSRRTVFVSSILATAVSSFTLGVIQTRGAGLNSYDAKLEAIRSEVRQQLGKPVAGDGVRAAGCASGSRMYM